MTRYNNCHLSSNYQSRLPSNLQITADWNRDAYIAEMPTLSFTAGDSLLGSKNGIPPDSDVLLFADVIRMLTCRGISAWVGGVKCPVVDSISSAWAFSERRMQSAATACY